MSAEDDEAIARRFIEAYNARNMDQFDELVAPDYVDHTHQQRGREAFLRLFTLASEGFPDWHEEIQQMIAEGDEVWVGVMATGTHSGGLHLFGTPLPPTGNKVGMEMVSIWWIAEGRSIEGREADDSVDFLERLGSIRYTDEGRQIFPEDQGQ